MLGGEDTGRKAKLLWMRRTHESSMRVPQDTAVSEMTRSELAAEYSEVGDELYFNTPTETEREALHDRRMELWNELKSRVDVDLPECPECGDNSWSQTPGDPKECTGCGYKPTDTDLVAQIDDAWDTILTE